MSRCNNKTQRAHMKVGCAVEASRSSSDGAAIFRARAVKARLPTGSRYTLISDGPQYIRRSALRFTKRDTHDIMILTETPSELIAYKENSQ